MVMQKYCTYLYKSFYTMAIPHTIPIPSVSVYSMYTKKKLPPLMLFAYQFSSFGNADKGSRARGQNIRAGRTSYCKDKNFRTPTCKYACIQRTYTYILVYVSCFIVGTTTNSFYCRAAQCKIG